MRVSMLRVSVMRANARRFDEVHSQVVRRGTINGELTGAVRGSTDFFVGLDHPKVNLATHASPDTQDPKQWLTKIGF